MKEQLILFETAKLAKEKGFDEPSDTYVTKGDKYETEEGAFFKNSYGFITASTQFLLQKWLREEHNIHIVIPGKWAFIIQTEENNSAAHGYDYVSYEEALEAGLQEALKLV
jgi:hypothetical protein